MNNSTGYIIGIGLLIVVLIYWHHRTDQRSSEHGKRMLKVAMQCHQNNDGIHALRFYKEAVKYGHIDAMLPIAQIYHHGIPNSIKENEDEATVWYEAVLSHPKSFHMARYLAQEALNQLKQAVIHTPFTCNDVILPIYEPPRRRASPPPLLHLRQPDDVVVHDPVVLGVHLRRNDDGELTVNKVSDSQNVHDSMIVQSLKNSVHRLEEAAAGKRQHDMNDMKKTLMQCENVPLSTREQAMRVLEASEKNDQRIGSLNMNETDVFRLVYQRIHEQDQDPERQQDMLDNLVKEMAEGEQGNAIMCATGRVTRMVDSLNGVDELIELKPSWAIRELMLSKAAQVRAELENEQMGEPKEGELLARISSTLHNEFVETNQITEDRLKAELDEWGAFV